MGRHLSRHNIVQPLLAAVLLISLAGCAVLPAAPAKPITTALPVNPELPLARLAATAPGAGLSGFHLMPLGQAAFQSRMDLIRRAQQSLDVQCYLIQDDDTGRTFLRLLQEAAERGVRVRLLLDDLYTAGQDQLLLGLAAHANVELRLFNPFPSGRDSLARRFAASLFDFGRVHRRMHNKLMVADGVMAVVGGRNIANEYFNRSPGDSFIDLDTLVIGAVVPSLSGLFDSYWNGRHAWPVGDIAATALTKDELRAHFVRHVGAAEAPQVVPAGVPTELDAPPDFQALEQGTLRWTWAEAEAYADDPDKILGDETPQDAAPPRDRQGIRYRLVERIRAARHEVEVATPYVVPTRRSQDTVALLRERGVRMAVLTNSLASTDEPAVHSGYRRYRGGLLEQGVELFELAPVTLGREARVARLGDSAGRLHAKVVVIDRQTFFIGSFNFDQRSATHNTELGLIVDSPVLAEQALALIDSLKRDGAYRLRLSPDGGGIHWMARGADGQEERRDEPETSWWRRLLLELLGLFVPEDLL